MAMPQYPYVSVPIAPPPSIGPYMGYPSPPKTAAELLDAQDGKMDGMYFGMKILAPTNVDLSSSLMGYPYGSASPPINSLPPCNPYCNPYASAVPSSPSYTSTGGLTVQSTVPTTVASPYTPAVPSSPTYSSSAGLTAYPTGTATLNGDSPVRSAGYMTGSLLGTPLGGTGLLTSSMSSTSPAMTSTALPSVVYESHLSPVHSPVRNTEGSTINISNTGWEKAVDDLKRDVDTLKSEGGMAALKDLLQMKVEELEKCRQSEMVKEKELHRLQDMYAEEIRKHTEDLAKVRKAEADLAMMKQAEADRLRQVQLEQERAAAEALAKIEAMKAEEALRKAKKGKKKAKKVAQKRTLR